MLSLRGEGGSDTPFLLTVGYVSPHCPFVAPPEDFELYRAAMRGTRSFPKVERELLALVVSGLNGCRY